MGLARILMHINKSATFNTTCELRIHIHFVNYNAYYLKQKFSGKNLLRLKFSIARLLGKLQKAFVKKTKKNLIKKNIGCDCKFSFYN